MENSRMAVPGDFFPVSGCVPKWIDISEVCKDVKRYVGLYAVASFGIVAINSGKAIYTTADVNGEFRRTLDRIVPETGRADTVVYDCEHHQQWLAPRDSAVRFLYEQF